MLGLARSLLWRFNLNFHGKMLAEPVVNSFFLTGIHHSLPPDITSSLVIFRNNVRVAGQYGNNRILPEPSTVIRVVDYLAILHKPIVTENVVLMLVLHRR
jgi:hypothetical protein